MNIGHLNENTIVDIYLRARMPHLSVLDFQDASLYLLIYIFLSNISEDVFRIMEGEGGWFSFKNHTTFGKDGTSSERMV